MCTYGGCTVFVPGVVLLALVGLAVPALVCWALISQRVTPALVAAGLAYFLFYATS